MYCVLLYCLKATVKCKYCMSVTILFSFLVLFFVCFLKHSNVRTASRTCPIYSGRWKRDFRQPCKPDSRFQDTIQTKRWNQSQIKVPVWLFTRRGFHFNLSLTCLTTFYTTPPKSHPKNYRTNIWRIHSTRCTTINEEEKDDKMNVLLPFMH